MRAYLSLLGECLDRTPPSSWATFANLDLMPKSVTPQLPLGYFSSLMNCSFLASRASRSFLVGQFLRSKREAIALSINGRGSLNDFCSSVPPVYIAPAMGVGQSAHLTALFGPHERDRAVLVQKLNMQSFEKDAEPYVLEIFYQTASQFMSTIGLSPQWSSLIFIHSQLFPNRSQCTKWPRILHTQPA